MGEKGWALRRVDLPVISPERGPPAAGFSPSEGSFSRPSYQPSLLALLSIPGEGCVLTQQLWVLEPEVTSTGCSCCHGSPGDAGDSTQARTPRETDATRHGGGLALRGPVLRGWALSGRVLRGPVMSGLALSGLVLRGRVLSGPVLRGLDLSGLALRGPVLRGWGLSSPVLRGPVLRGRAVRGPVLRGPGLSSPVLRGPGGRAALLGPVRLQGGREAEACLKRGKNEGQGGGRRKRPRRSPAQRLRGQGEGKLAGQREPLRQW